MATLSQSCVLKSQRFSLMRKLVCYFKKTKWGVQRNISHPLWALRLAVFCCSQHPKSLHKLRPPCSFLVSRCRRVSQGTTQPDFTQFNVLRSPPGFGCCATTCQRGTHGCGTMGTLCCTCYSALSVAHPLPSRLWSGSVCVLFFRPFVAFSHFFKMPLQRSGSSSLRSIRNFTNFTVHRFSLAIRSVRHFCSTPRAVRASAKDDGHSWQLPFPLQSTLKENALLFWAPDTFVAAIAPNWKYRYVNNKYDSLTGFAADDSMEVQ